MPPCSGHGNGSRPAPAPHPSPHWPNRSAGAARHLERKFLQQIGLPPKTVARIFRFEYAIELLAYPRGGLADIAVQAGYSDQAHLGREMNALAQCTPSELVATLRPTVPR
jgi:transcriptional regulator GlxA family with amidase domain